jgi:mRNA interferase YafQ
MTSIKTAASNKGSKRASLPRSADYAKLFLKDWERLTHSGRYDMRLLKAAMLLLIANDAPLAPEWLDHALKGEWIGHRECHIGGDFLLAYKIDDNSKTGMVVFVRAGTHAELFS